MNLPTIHNTVILFVCSVAGAAINSVAGGGTFITFPSLLLTGVPPIQAKATNTLGVIPGSIAAAIAYRREYAKGSGQLLIPLVGAGLVGALIGALVLLHTPQKTFLHLVPYLLGSATVLFIFSPTIARWVRGRTSKGGKLTVGGWAWTLGIELIIAVYIGYFGAGAGILTLALLALMGMESIHAMNAYKSLLVALSNAVAVVIFIVSGKIYWLQAFIMLIGAMAGGYLGAYFAQKVHPKYVRYIVVTTGFGLTAYFFGKYGF